MLNPSATALTGNQIECIELLMFTDALSGNKITIAKGEEFTIEAVWATDAFQEPDGQPSPALLTLQEIPNVLLTIHMLQYFKDKYKVDIMKHFEQPH